MFNDHPRERFDKDYFPKLFNYFLNLITLINFIDEVLLENVIHICRCI